LSKGPNYFWFGAELNARAEIDDVVPSVFVNRIADLTLEEWVAHLKAALSKTTLELAA
jgi:hypothetical protein